jgi:hypothetical protein
LNQAVWFLRETGTKILRPLPSKKVGSSAVPPPTAKFTPRRKSAAVLLARRYGVGCGTPIASAAWSAWTDDAIHQQRPPFVGPIEEMPSN